MGSTGARSIGGSDTKIEDLGLGKPAKIFDGNLPKDAGFDKHSANDIQVKVPVQKGKDIVFQFKLLGTGKLSIIAWDPNVPEKGRVRITTASPDLNQAIQKGGSDKANALIIRDLMNKSKAVNESNLPSIVNELKRRKNGK